MKTPNCILQRSVWLIALLCIAGQAGAAVSFVRRTTGPLVTDSGLTRGICLVDYDGDGWLNIYASTIFNLAAIVRVVSVSSGTLTVTLKSGARTKVSRRRRTEFELVRLANRSGGQ